MGTFQSISCSAGPLLPRAVATWTTDSSRLFRRPLASCPRAHGHRLTEGSPVPNYPAGDRRMSPKASSLAGPGPKPHVTSHSERPPWPLAVPTMVRPPSVSRLFGPHTHMPLPLHWPPCLWPLRPLPPAVPSPHPPLQRLLGPGPFCAPSMCSPQGTIWPSA